MKKESIYVGVLFALGLGLFALFQAPTLDQPLIESYGFRQTQTAYQTETLFNGEGSLLHPVLPVFGAPWQVPFEMPIFQFSAVIIMHITGLPSDHASRAASLVWTLLCAVPFRGLCRKFLNHAGCIAATLAFYLSPLSLLYSRASLIEYCALFFSLVFVNSSVASINNQSLVQLSLASLGAAAAAMVKVTTFLPAIIFLLFIVFQRLRNSGRSPVSNSTWRWASLVPCFFGLAAGTWWTRHADAIKEASPATSWLTSSSLRAWNFGTMDQRLHSENYRILMDDGVKLFGPLTFAAILLALPICFARRKYSDALAASILAAAVGVLGFLNLYLVHDYYYVAVIPYVAICLGGIIQYLTEAIVGARVRFTLATLLTIGVILSAAHYSKPSWSESREHFEYDRSLAEVIPNDSYVLVAARDWNPELLYAIQRRGLMLRPGVIDASYVRNLKDLNRYDYLVGPPESKEFLKVRTYFAPVAHDVFLLNEEASSFEGRPFYASYDDPLPAAPIRSFTLTCSNSDSLALATFPTPATLRFASSESGMIVFTSTATEVPADGLTLTIKSYSANERISCSNLDAVEVEILRASR